MKIEGIPDGWEPVRFDCANDGDAYLGGNGEILRHLSPRPTLAKRLIVRKIEKPKKYRPFANAAEFEPFRDRWVKHPSEPDKRFAPADYNNEGVWGVGGRMYDYATLFESGTLFDDGTPFGIEVTE